MLVNLHVKNMALIEETDISLSGGLTILTGETGAGKSIIIGSINAALGGRVSSDVIRKGAEYALVELVFQVDDPKRLLQLKSLEIPDLEEGCVIVTRKIMPSRSIFKVNGETMTVSQVREIAGLLIDIHGQHEHQSLLNEDKHLEITDRFLDKKSVQIKQKLSKEYDNYEKLKKEFAAFDIDEEQRNREISFLRHETGEINNASLSLGEDEELESRFKKMNNAQKIMAELSQVNELMYEGNQSTAGSLIGKSLRAISGIVSLDDEIDNLNTMLTEIDSLINDFNGELSSYMAGLDFDEEEYNNTKERLDLINELKMKYGKTIEQILEYRDEKEQRLEEFDNFDANKKVLQENLRSSEGRLGTLCDELTSIRKKAAAKLAGDITVSLKELNFLDVRFEVFFNKKESISRNGNDSVCFMISTNPGEDLKPLSKIASGGEMSRIMLAIKAALANKDDIDSLIFDEIDAGISGRTAQMVARKMHSIADTHQIICITHLPQIASMSDTHFLIEKNTNNDKTFTTIRKINEEEIVLELARLLGGNTITDKVIANAGEMRATAKKSF